MLGERGDALSRALQQRVEALREIIEGRGGALAGELDAGAARFGR